MLASQDPVPETSVLGDKVAISSQPY